ncbi:MAG: hypothetical protein PHV23_04290 [Candidatus Gracilibacteria bacterium]|nr:hypothetical protein [Candidatus Gracilibacteria bacterium]
MNVVTIKQLLDSSVQIAENASLEEEIDARIFDPFIENFGLLIEDAITYQVYGDDIPEGDSFSIREETPVKVETLMKINSNLDKYSLGDVLFANFYLILETDDEKEVFKETVEFIDELGTKKFIAYERGRLLSSISKSSPLYDFLKLITQGKTQEEAIDITLKKNGIDIKVNPKAVLNPKIKEYISNFQNHILGLIAQGNGGFLSSSTATLN